MIGPVNHSTSVRRPPLWLAAAAVASGWGAAGLMGWWHALKDVQADPAHSYNTLAHLFGSGPLT